ncbi:hypothetical protein [Clostridium magnum]
MLCISEKDKGKMKSIVKKLYEKIDDYSYFDALKSNKHTGINILNELEF